MSSDCRRLACTTAPTCGLKAATPAVQVRRDNPRLTTRREGGHAPVRMVMSRTLDLPQVGHLECNSFHLLLGKVFRA